eukprot:3025369-Rhodomonas_salina.3
MPNPTSPNTHRAHLSRSLSVGPDGDQAEDGGRLREGARASKPHVLAVAAIGTRPRIYVVRPQQQLLRRGSLPALARLALHFEQTRGRDIVKKGQVVLLWHAVPTPCALPLLHDVQSKAPLDHRRWLPAPPVRRLRAHTSPLVSAHAFHIRDMPRNVWP